MIMIMAFLGRQLEEETVAVSFVKDTERAPHPQHFCWLPCCSMVDSP